MSFTFHTEPFDMTSVRPTCYEPNSNLGGPKATLFVGSDVELRTRRTNQLNQTKKQFFKKISPE